jgi:hypothetical protein
MATFTKIAAVEVGSGGQSSIEFTAIPNSYTDLVMKVSIRDGSSSIQNNIIIKINGVTTDQSVDTLYGTGTGFPNAYSDTSFYGPGAVGNNATVSTFSNVELYITNYASTSNPKSLSLDTVTENNGTNAWQSINAGLYNSNTAITSITISPNGAVNFLQYSTATLYGIKKA